MTKMWRNYNQTGFKRMLGMQLNLIILWMALYS